MTFTTPRQTRQVVSIASIVDGTTEKFGVDARNRVWRITHRHSGCYLDGVNVEAQIPYWTCYYVGLEGFRVAEKEPILSWSLERPTILEELLRLSVETGDLVRDEKNGLLWIVNVSEFGLSLDGYDGNHWMPFKGLGVLSFGRWEKLSTKAQRKNQRC